VFIPNKTPPRFIELALAFGSEIFVPIIILFDPRLFPLKLNPVLSPKKLELLALTEPWPEVRPKKLELFALVENDPVLSPKKLELFAALEPFPAPAPKKLDRNALVAAFPELLPK